MAERPWSLRESYLFDKPVIAEIQRAAREGIYDIRGFGAKRRVPHFDDLLLLGASISRYPLEGYRERCDTNVTLGTRFARKPLELRIPITIAGMSFGALSAPAKEALGRGATEMGTSTTTGDGGMTPEEREHSRILVYQLLPSRYGMNPDDLRKADAIEVVVGQGAKPGGGGMLLGHKISDRVAEMRDLPKGIDQRSASRHPDWTGPDDLEIKIGELREITDWEKPVFVKVGATRTYYDVQLAVKAGADVIVVDGMQGGTAATQDVFIEHVGIPTLPAVRLAIDALQELGMHRQVQLVVSGGIRTGADVAKALALGADAVSLGTAALIAMGDNAPEHDEAYRAIGSAAGYYDDWQAGRDPVGISTQEDELAARFDAELGGRRIANYLRVLTLETQTLARACGKSHVHNLEPEDLVALTVEAAAMARVPLAGTSWIPGEGGLELSAAVRLRRLGELLQGAPPPRPPRARVRALSAGRCRPLEPHGRPRRAEPRASGAHPRPRRRTAARRVGRDPLVPRGRDRVRPDGSLRRAQRSFSGCSSSSTATSRTSRCRASGSRRGSTSTRRRFRSASGWATSRSTRWKAILRGTSTSWPSGTRSPTSRSTPTPTSPTRAAST